ncbi:MAG: hypothetical protein KDD53_01410, partial [Bdellovibrionales bacterium]|nr:hypothetical protein [Bdellovibrionales bacterium]
VPRKERERMTHLLFAWLELVTTPLDKIRASSHSSKPYLGDLVSLFEITCSVPDDEDILSILRRAEHQRSFQHGDQRENERGRRRRSRGTRRSKSSKRFF